MMNLLRNRPPRGVIYGALFFTVVLVVCYLFIDRPLAHLVREHQSEEMRAWAETLTQSGEVQWYFVPLGVLAIVCIPFRRDISSKCLYVICAIIASGVFNYLLKMLFGRARPSRYWDENVYGFHFFETRGSYFSFPSGHTVVVFSAFAAFGVLYPKLRVPFLITAFFLAFTRVLVEMHYLSDVIAGGLEGTLIAHLLAYWWIRPSTTPEPEMEELELRAEAEQEVEAENA